MRARKWVLLSLAGAGCGGELLLPPADALEDRWGALGIEVAATPFAATIGGPCIAWVAPRAIRVASDGTFQGVARRPAPALTLTEVAFSGRINGDTMFLTLTGASEGQYELRRGVPGDFAAFNCASPP